MNDKLKTISISLTGSAVTLTQGTHTETYFLTDDHAKSIKSHLWGLQDGLRVKCHAKAEDNFH